MDIKDVAGEELEKSLELELNPKAEQVIPEENGTPPPKEEPKDNPKPKEEPKKDDDLEIDLGFDVDGKTPLKLKRSEILDLKKSGMLQADYTKKTQEIAAEKEQMKEVVEILDFLKKNPGKAEKVIKILEDKEVQLEKQEDKLEDKKDEIEELLKDLDEDDPYAKILIAQKKQFEQALSTNKKLQERLDKMDLDRSESIESKQQDEASKTLKSTLDAQKAALKIDEDEAEFWRKSVLTHLVNKPKEYQGLEKEKFVEYLEGISKKVYEDLQRFGERKVKQYIESKGKAVVPVTPEVKGGKPLKAAPTLDNLQSIIEADLIEQQK